MPKMPSVFDVSVAQAAPPKCPSRSASRALFRNCKYRAALLSALMLASSGACAYANGTCDLYNPTLYTKGTTYRIVYRITAEGPHSYRDVEDFKVVGPAVFHSHHVIDVRKHMSEAMSPSIKVSSIVDSFYGKGKNVMYIYGSRAHEGGRVFEHYNKPPIAFLRRYTVNVPYSETDTQSNIGYGSNYTITSATTTMLLGKVRITIPAGTFIACKIKITSSRLSNGVQPGIGYDWIAASGRYAGLLLKNIYVKPSTGSTTPLSTKIALSLQLNGK